ncbi:molybdenum cofactor guanylyltransferase [Campylobacter helveticus]|nr:molybdenum cofactor guanylyltransferase [Campylobacter helveticus]MCR2039469.1 molybdenum cofactor guanylyltransferase [Campylobacter helveticus]MCR2054493.1 molybdenum cofactor guanylyltransferase [Campylobacter helveticus]MCR2060031.1 molybdenum cofactor guanylyltransferase [Campylobacter helveticus]MCR2061458.1 molybdenum cofactor guanylyltransferase [Campylobacter helveticus]MCR2063527.1 molybdenum cofactor guanylyltransferase [Campylobacter helveticus]
MKMSAFLNAVILCGGKSSRMGKDKSLLKINQKSLAELAHKKLTPLFKKVYLSSKDDKFNFKADIIKDDISFQIYSPMLALYSILKHFKDEFVFILGVDFVRFSEKELEKLELFLNQNYQIIIPKTKLYKHSLCGFYHASLTPLCEEMLQKNEQKISLLFDKASTKFVDFESEKAFLNLNYYDEFLKYQSECR